MEHTLFFYELIKRAQKHTSLISPECESYTVFLLSDMAIGKPVYSNKPLFEILQRAEINPSETNGYKRLGDSALVTLGLFPEKLKKLNISEAYVRNMGAIGYSKASSILSGNQGFVFECMAASLADVAETIKKAKGLAPFNVVS